VRRADRGLAYVLISLQTVKLYVGRILNAKESFLFSFGACYQVLQAHVDDIFLIPPYYRPLLFPDPTCSISEFLQFDFPPQAGPSNTPETEQYWSPSPPGVVDIEKLKSLAIPCRAAIQDIKDQILHHHSVGEATSIQYRHLWHGLASTADAETTFVECIEGQITDVTPLQGWGLRRKRKNVLYSAQWWTDNSNYDSDS